jgi:hypothetical protein
MQKLPRRTADQARRPLTGQSPGVSRTSILAWCRIYDSERLIAAGEAEARYTQISDSEARSREIRPVFCLVRDYGGSADGMAAAVLAK